MGREIRRVPLDWEHPTYDVAPYGEPNRWDWTGQGRHFMPLFDRTLAEAQAEWDAEAEHCYERPNRGDFIYYRPDWGEAELGYQFYETVTEGTPRSPVFATLTELSDFLVTTCGYSRLAADGFCQTGWAPSFVVDSGGFRSGVEACASD